MGRIAIAIDGPASSGKGTVARGVARALGYAYVDTGALYRTLALVASRAGVDWDDAPALTPLAEALDVGFSWNGEHLAVTLGDEDVSRAIRQGGIGGGASRVSRHPAVRDALLERQRAWGRDGGVVMDGRDIGTVVLPDAACKVFLTASLDERARRRHDELVRRGEAVTLADVHDGLARRDAQDAQRDVAPLVAAPDALVVDTTTLSIPEAIGQVLALARARGA